MAFPLSLRHRDYVRRVVSRYKHLYKDQDGCAERLGICRSNRL